MKVTAALLLAFALRAAAEPPPPEPELAPAPAVKAARSYPVSVSYDTDPRVELLSIVEMLARPAEFRERLDPGTSAYAESAWTRFAPFSGHAAVLRLRALPPERRDDALTRALLTLSEPPGLEGDAAGVDADLLSGLRAFARDADFQGFYKGTRESRGAMASAARAEAGRGLRPDSMTAYLRKTGTGSYRFVLAPLLPSRMTGNLSIGDGPRAVHLRVRAPQRDKRDPWGFSEFDTGPAHEIGHVLLDSFVDSKGAALGSSSALMFDGCANTWEACALEQLDVAVTLRALAAERGEAVAGRMFLSYSTRYPQLGALCERLKEWEARRDPDFRAFYPRLGAVFAEARGAKPEPALEPAAAGGPETVPVSFATDPRIELLSVLLLLSRPEAFQPGASASPYAARARKAFAGFASDPAVLRLRSMTAAESDAGLVEVFLSLSAPPELAVPAEPVAAARAASRAELLREARDFARRASFLRFYEDNAAFYAGLVEEAKAETARGLRPSSVAAYLRAADAGRHRFVAAPLLPPEMAANVVAGSGPDRLYSWVRAADDRKKSPLSFDTFGASPAHDVGHSLADPLGLAHRAELDASRALMFEGCAATWAGCAQEQVNVAITLRALAAERGEPAYEEMLGAYEGRYPSLRDLCARLREWEKTPGKSFADFYPRLIAVFREELAAKASAPGSPSPRPRRRP